MSLELALKALRDAQSALMEKRLADYQEQLETALMHIKNTVLQNLRSEPKVLVEQRIQRLISEDKRGNSFSGSFQSNNLAGSLTEKTNDAELGDIIMELEELVQQESCVEKETDHFDQEFGGSKNKNDEEEEDLFFPMSYSQAPIAFPQYITGHKSSLASRQLSVSFSGVKKALDQIQEEREPEGMFDFEQDKGLGL